MGKAISLFVAIALLLSSSAVWAQTDDERNMYLGLFVGYAEVPDLQMTDERETDVILNYLTVNRGETFGAKVGYLPRKEVALELEYADIRDTDADEPSAYIIYGDDVGLKGNISMTSVFLNFLVRYPHGWVHPYVGWGPGWSWVDFEDVTSTYDGPAIVFRRDQEQDDRGSAFANQVLAGLEMDVTEHTSFVLGYKYYYCRPSFDFFKVKLEYKAHLITAGFSYRFW